MSTETPIHYTVAWHLADGRPLLVAPLGTSVNHFNISPANDAEAMSLARLAVIDTGVTDPMISAFAVEHCSGCKVYASAVPFDMESAVEAEDSETTNDIVEGYLSRARMVGEVTGLPMFGTGILLADDKPEIDNLLTMPSEQAWGKFSQYLQMEIEKCLESDALLDGYNSDRFQGLWVDFSVKAHKGFIYLINDGANIDGGIEKMDELIDGEISMEEYNDSMPEEVRMSMFAQAQELKIIPSMIRAAVVRAASLPVLHRTDIISVDDVDDLITSLEKLLRDQN